MTKLMSEFLDGGHDVISRRKLLQPGSEHEARLPAPEQQRFASS